MSELAIGVWRNIGGGCGVACDRPEFCCDDEYEHAVTGERVTVYSTQDRHFNMPRHVGSVDDLYALNGVMEALWRQRKASARKGTGAGSQ